MFKISGLIALGFLVSMTAVGYAGQAASPKGKADRFETTSIKAVRPNLVKTLTALQKKDVKAAREAFEAYDSAWNGVEVYINTRSTDLYAAIEQKLQAKITEGLKAPSPDFPTLVSDTQAMIAKYDEAISLVEKSAPLNPLFDDVARLRIVRAHLREVNPALKAGEVDKARKSFNAFNDNWDSIEDLVKQRSSDAYVAIEAGMIQIERAFMPKQPDSNEVTTLVSGVMDKYNAIVTQVTREARAAK